MIQKEEERARKKIEQTKERALEIMALRQESEKRVNEFIRATGEEEQLRKVLLAKNKEQEFEGKVARAQRVETLINRRREGVTELKMEKKQMTQQMIDEQERQLRKKQEKREEIKRMEEAIRLKKEAEQREKERKIREYHEQRMLQEEEEARKAAKLVKALEKKEREWIEKLRQAQTIQESAFEQLESALIRENIKTMTETKTRDITDDSENLQVSSGSLKGKGTKPRSSSNLAGRKKSNGSVPGKHSR